MDQIVNKVDKLPLYTIDIKELYQNGVRIQLKFSDLINDGVLIEKQYRKQLKEFNWNQFNNSFVYVTFDKDQIIPSWAYLLLSHYLSKVCKDFVIGSLRNLEEKLYVQKISNIDLDLYSDKKVIIKGCSETPYSEIVYFELTRRLSGVVYSLMYGEPCSRVPIFKRPKKV